MKIKPAQRFTLPVSVLLILLLLGVLMIRYALFPVVLQTNQNQQPVILAGDRILCSRLSFGTSLPLIGGILRSWNKPKSGEYVVFKNLQGQFSILNWETSPGELFRFYLGNRNIEIRTPKKGDTLNLKNISPENLVGILSVLKNELREKTWNFQIEFKIEGATYTLGEMASLYNLNESYLDSLFKSPAGGFHLIHFENQLEKKFPDKEIKVRTEIRQKNQLIGYHKVRENYGALLGNKNRPSLDSRYWGFIPLKYIYAKPVIVLWSKSLKGQVRWKRILKIIK